MRVLVQTGLAIAFCIACVLSDTTSSAQAGPVRRPNIVLLNLDDADTDLLSTEMVETHFPAIAELYERSTIFTNAHCTTPFCAPSRAALFTGKYGFNNGCKTGSEQVASSVGFNGGYQRFKSNGHDENELGVWMKRAGYRTIHVGKFHHNGWDDLVPAGWDDFSVDLGAKYYGTSRFTNINHNPPRRYAIRADQYITHEDDREVNLALDNHDQQRPGTPFFLYLAPIAPHFPNNIHNLSSMAGPEYQTYAQGLRQPRDDPDYNEADLSDKPIFLQRGPLTKTEEAHLQQAFLYRLRSMKSVDDMVGRLVDRLRGSGQLGNTYFFITSDNGYSLGHHRLLYKKDPYQRSSGVPLAVYSPTSKKQHKASHLIAHLDICPTIAELGGATTPDDIDGKSFATLINAPRSRNATSWRRSIMIENWANKGVQGKVIPMAYTAERFYDRIHIGWYNGDHEFYRMSNDPFQLKNVYDLLNVRQRNFLNASLLSFRKKDVPPNLTMTSPVIGQCVGGDITFQGFIEDNSVPVLARLVVKSFQTGRFFNGGTWQDDFVAIPILPSSLTSSISDWKHDLPIFSESKSNFDTLVSWVTPQDDSMNFGHRKFSVNPIVDHSIFAEINPSIDGRVFSGTSQRMIGFNGRYPGQTIDVSILDQQARLYFNGQSWQRSPFWFAAESLSNRRWSKSLHLPPGHYLCSAQARVGELYQADPATAEFTVQ